ncbi:hypothetical protein [Sulfuricurvum sp.]|nr:hypothetical protein [Sulfuricurvum sp.]
MPQAKDEKLYRELENVVHVMESTTHECDRSSTKREFPKTLAYFKSF